MNFQFIDKDWYKEFSNAVSGTTDKIILISPFIQLAVVKELIGRSSVKIKVITRFNLREFYEGVSDLNALKYLVNRGAEIRGIKNLHAKVYIFDSSKAFITSANLTKAALKRNHEFGIVTENKEFISRAGSYFNSLWDNAGPSLTNKKLLKWEEKIDDVRRTGGRPNARHKFPDYGNDLGIPQETPETESSSTSPSQWFIKFFGTNSRRAPRSLLVIEQVSESGCHWACTYPKGKRPRQVKDTAIMFIARLVKDPGDILIFGRAVGSKHMPGRDDATDADIALREWKPKWPHYIRVRDAEFIAGKIGNGISMTELMETFKHDSFKSTARNMRMGKGNTNPKHAYSQQAAVELTSQAANWLNSQLDAAFKNHGKLSDADLESLDWPS